MKVTIVFLLMVYGTTARAGVPSSRATAIGVTECPPEQEHDWTIEYLMRHENCNMFYQCVHGKPVAMNCVDGLFFDLYTWRCEWAHLVDCTDRIEPTTTTTSPPTLAPTTTTPTTTTTTTPAPTTTTSSTTTTTPAPTTTTTTTTPAPTTTTTTTTTPAPTTTTTTTTPAPTTTTTTTTTPAPTTTTTTTTTPAPTTTTTTTTTPVPTTTTTTTTTPAPTTTTTTTTTPAPTTTIATTTEDDSSIEFQDNGCPVNPHIHWLLPHEYDCNLFYYCVWGELVLRQCPANLHFNTKIQVCDWPQDAGCTLSGSKAKVSIGEWFRNLF